MAIFAVTGLQAEARIARRAGFAVVCAGGTPAHTAAAVGQAIGSGRARGLLSFGIAGGLAPGLQAGTLVLARAILTADGRRYPVDEIWRARLNGCIAAVEGDVFGGNATIGDPTEKAALYAHTGALAVDLESAVVAEAAVRAALPYLVIRAIADPAERALPPAARIRLKPDGQPDLGRILGSVLAEPRQIGALIGLALEARRALRMLMRVVLVARPLLDAPR
jgi:adenosylhomocysteine nucleosidase